MQNFYIANVCIIYTIIAFQFAHYVDWRNIKSEASKAFLMLLTIFILCMSAGWLPDLWREHSHTNHFTHIPLVIVGWYFVITQQIRHIARVLGR